MKIFFVLFPAILCKKKLYVSSKTKGIEVHHAPLFDSWLKIRDYSSVIQDYGILYLGKNSFIGKKYEFPINKKLGEVFFGGSPGK